MQPNESLIYNFYTAFINRDYPTMQNSYTDDATFSDPVFQHLNATEVRCMWEMFCKRANDMDLSFTIDKVTENEVIANWIPRYTFSATGKFVENHITSTFTIRDNKIVSHIDHFDIYKWSRQAFGVSGMLLGWTNFMQTKIRTKALGNLHKFMATHQ